MRSFLRRSLIWTLAVALVVAGLPLAHARDCDTLHVHAAQPAHHNMQMTDAANDMAMDHAAMMDSVSPPHHDGSPVPMPCKCLNCSSLCAAFVAPVPHGDQLERRVDAIIYVVRAAGQRDVTIFIDPGIPIVS